jgi:stage II sporulation protein D
MTKQTGTRLGITLVVLAALIYTPSLSAFSFQQRLRAKSLPSAITSQVLDGEEEAPSWKGEPLIRVGIATNVKIANVSSTQGMLKAAPDLSPEKSVATSRLRLEARSLTDSAPVSVSQPLVATNPSSTRGSFVEVSGLRSRSEAENASTDIKALIGELPRVLAGSSGSDWRLAIGMDLTAERARRLKSGLEEQGFLVNIVSGTDQISGTPGGNARASISTQNSKPSLVRSVSRVSAPARETVAFDATSTRLFSSRNPVVIAPSDGNSGVKFNDKAFRGRLEVFANSHGSLTVVNVLGLEDYVRGVVANELSPEVFPELEALKAQAIAARTYAVRHKNQFASQGFDVLPTTQSQVYGGMSTERPLADRAVRETRGIIATYEGRPIDAVYTSTCGGRTEDAEHIFNNDAVPYLRGRECSIEGPAGLSVFTVKTSRATADIRDERNGSLARDAALLEVHGFELSRRINDAWLLGSPASAELRSWLALTASLAHQSFSQSSEDLTRPPGFASALAMTVFGEKRADTLLDNADVDYLLGFRDAAEVPARNRADVALLVREGVLTLYPDATLRPREAISRARALHAIARILEGRGLFQTQKGTTRPSLGGALVLRSGKNRDQTVNLSPDLFLLRAIGDAVFQVRALPVVGGESVIYHLNRNGQTDYLEVAPAPNGASADRFSNYTNWNTTLALNELQSRLSRWLVNVGTLRDLKVSARGSSRRVTDLELVGSQGSAHIRGGRIRSALGLREQLFVIDRQFEEDGRVTSFTFTGRGFGHGVGMCQVGAYGLARAGYTFDRILKTYYTGIELEHLY